MKIVPPEERGPLHTLVQRHGLVATVYALGVVAGEIAEHSRTCKIPQYCDLVRDVAKYERASRYLTDRVTRAPSLEDL